MTTTLDHHPRTLALRRLTDRSPWERTADRRDRVGLALSGLFAARDDLGGISLVADVLAEDLLWSV